MKIEGLYTALVTPVADNEIDTAAFGDLLDHVIAGGSDGLVVLGGTGEYCALTMGQREAAIACCVERSAGTLPLVVGILNPGLSDAIEMGRRSKELGADAIMLVTPYYVLADHEGLLAYHLKFMDAVDLPLILYNIPHRTLVNMQPETVAEIVERSGGQVIGIKECTTSVSQLSRLISMVADRIAVICGEEPLLCTSTIMGATAAILATSNVIPRFWKEMLTAIGKDDIAKAVQMHLDIQPFLNLVFSESNPGPLKAALKQAGIDCGDALLPLHPPGKAVAEKLAREMLRIEKWWN
jgi:4-hydroxy-tetrahydrodipicolinate synthase